MQGQRTFLPRIRRGSSGTSGPILTEHSPAFSDFAAVRRMSTNVHDERCRVGASESARLPMATCARDVRYFCRFPWSATLSRHRRESPTLGTILDLGSCASVLAHTRVRSLLRRAAHSRGQCALHPPLPLH